MRLQVSLRVLMLLVAAAAVVAGPLCRYALTLRRRSREYSEAAQISAISSRIHSTLAKMPYARPEDRSAQRKAARWYAKRSEEYKRAARFPIVGVADEPAPEIPAPTRDLPPLPPIPKASKPIQEMTKEEQQKYLKVQMKFIEDLKQAVEKRRAARTGGP